VAQGVIGIAFIQAMLIGLALLVAGVPWAGVLAAITLVLGIAQVPALIVILPAIAYIWVSGNYGGGAALCVTIQILLSRNAAHVRNGRQCPEAADAGPRRRCADAGHSARGTGRHGHRRNPGHVRWRHATGARLSDLHGMGRSGSGCGRIGFTG